MVTHNVVQDQTVGFGVRLRARASEIRSWLCVGLDPDTSWLPPHLSPTPEGVVEFCRRIVEATAGVALCFKLNLAFFEVLGPDGWRALYDVRASIPVSVPVIADAKRGDIGNTDRAYAKSLLEVLDVDAVTVNPYLGRDSIEPFVSYPGKAALLLCKTSNPGASDLQDLQVDGSPLFMRVARMATEWNGQGEAGLVVGATQPEALTAVRRLSEEVLLLVPGVGAQGADAREALIRGANEQGNNAIIAVSRQILCASAGSDFAQAAGRTARAIAEQTWSRE